MGKAKFQSSFKPSKKQRKEIEDTMRTLQALDAIKMVSFYVLRNQGWGPKRIARFNDKMNEYIEDISLGYFTLEDIAGVLKDECGLSLEDLKIRPVGIDIS